MRLDRKPRNVVPGAPLEKTPNKKHDRVSSDNHEQKTNAAQAEWEQARACRMHRKRAASYTGRSAASPACLFCVIIRDCMAAEQNGSGLRTAAFLRSPFLLSSTLARILFRVRHGVIR